jgi:N-acylneuraminate cytidylyltransferase
VFCRDGDAVSGTGEVVGFVFCRGGSKGLPGKNLRLLGGIPLVARAVGAALASPRIDRVIVSTEDPGIADVARDAGAEIPFLRPKGLATDEAPELLAWKHALDSVASPGRPISLFVSVPATAPLRTVDDLDRCIEAAMVPGVDMAVTVSPSARNPYYDLVRMRRNGMLQRIIDVGAPVHRRQDAPPVFAITPVCYAAKPSWVQRASAILDGRIVGVEVPPERAIDVDSLLELTLAEVLLSRTDL